MCGICGIYNLNGNIVPGILKRMTKLMRHRGPDDEGYILLNTGNAGYESLHSDDTIDEIKIRTESINSYKNEFYNLGFGFRRLSILDLSEHGHQPMSFEETELHIVFNGEIYNYIEIREELKSYGYKFSSNTDTEVILKSYHRWGEECVHRFNGMWAFAIWDKRNKKLFCSRDRFGVKPFYYYHKPGDIFVFASEIKPLLLFVNPEENIKVIANNFANGLSDYNKETFFKNIYQLRGSRNLTITNGTFKIYRYYSILVKSGYDTFEKSCEKLKELMFDAVKIRLRSDVDVGYALSGGIDSSSIVCIANELKTSDNHTFSMIYPGNPMDESKYVDYVISKTNFKKHTITPAFKEFIKDLDNFVYYHEEPFGGLSFYGEHRVRELTHKNGIKVCLDGQGADEIFTGYPSVLIYYFKDLLKNFKFLKLKRELNEFKHQCNINLIHILKSFLKNNTEANPEFIKKKYPYLNPEIIYNNSNITDLINNKKFKINSYLNRELYQLLFNTSLPRLLTGADKISMSYSLECRFPFLDYRVVEYAFNIPYHYKVNSGYMKYILREAMKGIIPDEIYVRKDKIGFVLPENEFSEKNLSENIKNSIYNLNIQNDIINMKSFKEYYYGKCEREKDWKFWKILSYLLWYDKFIGNKLIH